MEKNRMNMQYRQFTKNEIKVLIRNLIKDMQNECHYSSVSIEIADIEKQARAVIEYCETYRSIVQEENKK
jgi:hypothetical protein